MAVFRFVKEQQPDEPLIRLREAEVVVQSLVRKIDSQANYIKAREAELEAVRQLNDKLNGTIKDLQGERPYLFIAIGVGAVCSFLGVIF